MPKKNRKKKKREGEGEKPPRVTLTLSLVKKMAGSIKGITIEFMGDTTKLDKALRDVSKSTRAIDSELRQVNRSLKFNPGNIDLLRQKQTLLADKIKATEGNLKELKNMQKQVADDPSQGKNSEAYRKLQREIIKSENQLKRFNAEQRRIQAALSPLGQFSAKMKDVGDRLTKAGNAMKGFSAAGAAVAGSLGVLAYKSGLAADDLNTLAKTTGLSTKDLQKYKLAANQVDVSVEAIAKSHTVLKKNMLTAAEGGSSAKVFKQLGVSVKDANGNLRDADTVWQEAITKLGNMKNATERDALAMKLMGKSATELNPLIEDGGETYKRMAELYNKYDLELVDQETLNKANEFNDSIDDIKSIATITLQSIGSALAGYLAPALAKVVNMVGLVAGWLNKLSPQVLTIIATLGVVVAAIAPALILAGKFALAISAISNAMALFGVSVNIALGPLALIGVAIAAVIAIGVLLYKNWDTIKARLKGLQQGMLIVWNGIKTKTLAAVNSLKTGVANAFNGIKAKATAVFNAVKGAITRPISTAVSTVRALIGKLKNFFPLKVGRVFSGLKLPHFNIKGGKAPFGIGGKGVKPTISVDWYAKGGIFNSPSIIGVGEKGPEAVVPLDKLWKTLSNANTGDTNIVININGANSSPSEIAEEVKRKLIAETNRRRLAWQ